MEELKGRATTLTWCI